MNHENIIVSEVNQTQILYNFTMKGLKLAYS